MECLPDGGLRPVRRYPKSIDYQRTDFCRRRGIPDNPPAAGSEVSLYRDKNLVNDIVRLSVNLANHFRLAFRGDNLAFERERAPRTITFIGYRVMR
ncbi:UNVERIFIED_CONTAM: hypothetical protein PYX00_009448 [Menopon gallinae]|uniref:Uncharacterized protein n=1 Tax=Menopon gallinae TaxID=328185 RepID=A0AAW2HBP3_9NEOP